MKICTYYGLSHCIRCEQMVCELLEYEEADLDTYLLSIRCANCQAVRNVRAKTEDCQKWEKEVLDPSEEALQSLWDDIDAAKFQQQIDSFVGALAVNAITPEDF